MDIPVVRTERQLHTRYTMTKHVYTMQCAEVVRVPISVLRSGQHNVLGMSAGSTAAPLGSVVAPPPATKHHD